MANYETTNTFNAEQCNKDIDNARADINRAMHSLRCALERLDKAQACLKEGIKCDAEVHLNSARLGAKYANRCAIKSSERILRIISELYAAGVKQDLNDEDDSGECA